MADGDKAIYRDSNGTFDLDQTAFTGVPFNIQVVEEAPFTQNVNDIDVDLGDAGHYLVGYSLLGTGGGARLGFLARLTQGGSPIAYGRGHCTTRNASQDNPGIHGSTILDVTAGQDIRVEVFEISVNTNNCPLDANKSGFWMLKLNDAWSYARLREVGGGQLFNTTTFTDVDWDTDDELDTADFTRAGAADELTLDTTGHYLVCYNVTITTGTSTTRTQHLSRLALNGTAVEASYSGAYLRGSNGTNEGVLSGMVIINATANDVLTVQVARESGASTTNFANECSLTVVKLPDTGEYLRVHESGGIQESNPSSPTIIDFDTEDEEDTASFVHAAGRATVQKTDDYLFTYGSQETGGIGRAQMWKEWHIGGTIQQWGGCGNYSRGNTTWSGSSTGAIFALTASDIVDMRHTRKGDTTSKLLQPDRYGMTAVNLGTLFVAAGETLVVDTGVYALNGQIANGAIATPADVGSYALSGQASLFGITLPLDTGAHALSGQAILGQFITPADVGAYALAGVDISLAIALAMDTGTYVLTGVDTNLLAAYRDLADTGAYAIAGADFLGGIITPVDTGVYVLTGVDVEMLIGFILAVDTGIYTLTGVDTNLLRDLILRADTGSHAITGQAADLLLAALTRADTGSYVLTGIDADFFVSILMAADTGVYTVSGVDVEFLRDLIIEAIAGSYSLAGQAAKLVAAYKSIADTGGYSLTGLDAALRYGAVTLAGTGTYLVTGVDMSMTVARMILANPGAYTITGKDATLIFAALHPNPLPTGVLWKFIIRKKRGRGA